MTIQTPPLPVPRTLVDCPWCGTPVEIRPEATALECDGCLVCVDLAMDALFDAGSLRTDGSPVHASRARALYRSTRPAVPSAA